VYERRLPNETEEILGQLHPMKADIVGLAVELTYNWYWLVDALMDEGYPVHLANPSAMKMYEGRKHTDDRHDAFWLADLLHLGVLPEGYFPFLLPGLIRCMRCGRHFQGYTTTKKEPRKDGTKVKTLGYACNGYLNGGKAVCPRTVFRKESLEQDILARIAQRVDWMLANGGKSRLRAMVVNALRAEMPDTSGEKEETERRLGDVQEQTRRLVDAVARMDSCNIEVIN
jgi:hypothetical protein